MSFFFYIFFLLWIGIALRFSGRGPVHRIANVLTPSFLSPLLTQLSTVSRAASRFQVVEEYCGTCSGQGLVEKTKQVKVRHQEVGMYARGFFPLKNHSDDQIEGRRRLAEALWGGITFCVSYGQQPI